MLVLVASVQTSHASTQDFYFSEFRADYYVGVDDQTRSTLKTVEVLTAVFPDFDQNHGIERAIPKSYDGHPTHLTIQSVTDKNDRKLNYTTYDSNDNLVVRVGDANRYVRGEQTYKITYTQRDVTRYFQDTDDDEFYWDTNGLEWQQQFQRVSATVHIAKDLQNRLTKNSACVFGYKGSTETCQITQKKPGVFSATSPRPLSANENMTIAVGFQPRTFSEYKMTLFEQIVRLWTLLQVAAGILIVPVAIWLLVRYQRINDRTRELKPITPQYTPPKDISVTTSARLIGSTKSVMAAQLLDLAVRHYVKIYEAKKKKWYRAAEYEVEIIKDPSTLMWEEKELLSDTFGEIPAIGTRLNLKTLKNNTSYYSRTLNNDKDLDRLIRSTYALRQKDDSKRQWFRRIATITAIASVVLLFPVFLIVALIAFGLSFAIWPLTDKGLEIRRYLEGFKDYIKLAETDRLKALQSPEGVEKVGESVGDDLKKRLELYERTLPYAVLFGQEKEWNKQLGTYYEKVGAQPDWYSSHTGAFHAASFGAAMSNFSSATNYASSSSSSSGGSSGGGSSGGGGGGGGGGGW